MANNAEPTRVAVIGLDYWGPNLVRNFAAAYNQSQPKAVIVLPPYNCPPSAFVRRIEGIF